MLTLISPQLQEIGELKHGELEGYLQGQKLRALKYSQKNTWVIFPEEYGRILDLVDEGSVPVIVSFDGSAKLRDQILSYSRQSDMIAFRPTRNAMRKLYSLEGFVRVAQDLAEDSRMKGFALPPGVYGDKHLVVFSIAQ